VFRSPQVSSDAVQRLSEQGVQVSEQDAVSRIAATARRGTNYIEVHGTGTSAPSAQRLTRAFVESYFDYRRDLQRRELLRLQEGLQDRLDAAEDELRALTEGGGAADSPEGNVLRDRVSTARDLVEAVQLRLSVDTSQAQLLSSASLPSDPTNALSLPTAVLMSLLGALGVAAAAVFGLELLKDPVRTRHEVQRLAAAPVLATIPCSPGKNGSQGLRRELAGSTAGRMLKVRLDGFSPGGPIRRVLISTMTGDAEAGRCAALALAGASASAGLRVLLIADDIAAPSSPARTDGQQGGEPTSGVAPRMIDGVAFLRVTSASGGASALFDSAAPADTLASLSSSFDLTILLTSGHSSVSAESMSHLFQVVLVVCAVGRTRGRRFRSYLEDLRMNGVSITGVVATQPAPRKGIRQLAGGTGRAARGDEVAAGRAVPTGDDGLHVDGRVPAGRGDVLPARRK
jgi:capsular polysaccharide biosynthesis protein